MTLSTPQQIQARLEQIEADLAERQNSLEAKALAWFKKKRDREYQWARAYMAASGTVPERKAKADYDVAMIGAEEEAAWEAAKAVVRVLETRSNIGMALLKSQGRA